MEFDDAKDLDNLLIKRSRKKTNYKKVNNELRQRLIEMVYLKDYLLKDAARILGINYSTAKTILRIFRIEKRVEKKNAEEERNLKNFLTNYKKNNEIIEQKSLVSQVSTASNEKEETFDFKNDLIAIKQSLSQITSTVQNCFEHITFNQNRIEILLNVLARMNLHSFTMNNQVMSTYDSCFY